MIQPQGEPREHHLGEVWPKSLSYTKYSGAFFKKCKIVKNLVQKQKSLFLVNLSENVQKLCFFGSCDLNFNFFLKHAPDYNDPSGHFVIYEIFVAQTSIIIFQVLKSWISAIYDRINHSIFFLWIFLRYLSTSFISKKFKSTIRRFSWPTSKWSSTRKIEIEM